MCYLKKKKTSLSKRLFVKDRTFCNVNVGPEWKQPVGKYLRPFPNV